MSGISTGTGLFSGVDSRSIIDQLISIEARPRVFAQQRITSLQRQQAALLDLSARVTALRAASAGFRTDSTFRIKTATTSDETIATATASNTASPGAYSFRIDRLVSSQQLLTRGFANRDSSGLGLSSITVEGAQARLDTDIALADLNDGAGVRRGRLTITDSGARVATIDLSRAVSVNDVLKAINENGTAQVRASVQGGRLVVSDNAGGSITIADAQGSQTATSLGIAGTATGRVTGSVIYGAGQNTTLGSLNDGRGVSIRASTGLTSFNFEVVLSGATTGTARVNIGSIFTQAGPDDPLVESQPAVSTLGGVVERMNQAFTAAGLTTVSASIDSATSRLVITDSAGGTVTVNEGTDTTARDLGLLTTGSATGTYNGSRILAGLNSTLLGGLNGGAGVDGDGVLNITARDGTSFGVLIDSNWSLSDLADAIATASGTTPSGGPRVTLALDERGTGFTLRDNTGATGNLIVQGTAGFDSAASLGIATDALGVASSTVQSGDRDRAYFSRATLLTGLNSGRGVGTGTFRIIDGAGGTTTINIGGSERTLGEIIDDINASSETTVRARVNSTGDGLELYDTGTGSARIRVEDVTGTVARSLNILGTATGTGTGADNRINGTLERTIAIEAGDTLDAVVRKVNDAGAGVLASVINDGSSSAPFRLTFSSTQSGRSGRFVLTANGADLGLSTLSDGQDAVLFYGSGDPASAIVATSASNTFSTIVPGLTINAVAPSDRNVTISVASNTTAIVDGVKAFVSAYNELLTRVDTYTNYDEETETKGVLLGDSTALSLRSTMSRVISQRSLNVASRYNRLTDVGITFTRDGKGKIELNEQKLLDALRDDPASVEALFATRVEESTTTPTGSNESVTTAARKGAMALIEDAANRYVNSVDGILTSKNRGIDTQIRSQNDRISQINLRLESRRALLESQFAAMEKAIGKLQIQGSALGSIGAR